MRIPIAITDDMQSRLGCEGVRLESAFVEDQASRSTVFVFHVDPARSWTRTASPVIKFSEEQYAIPRAEHLHLATPRYYRKYEGDGVGIRDEMEATYQEDVRSFLSRYKTMDAATVGLVSGHVAYGVDDFWMFCTSVTPMSNRERERSQKEFAADCITIIPDPSEFARDLGAAFAAHSSWANVDLSARDELMRMLRPPEFGDKVVKVYHGPVCYSSDAQKLVDSFDVLYRPAVVSFLKRQTFAWQKEYRFTVKIDGKPTETDFLLLIPPDLRRLTKIE